MADEDQAAVAAPEVAPVAEAPVVEAPVVETVAEPEFTPHTATETLLETIGEEEKPAEEAKPEEVKSETVEEPKPEAEAAPEVPEAGLEVQPEPIVYEAFKLPGEFAPEAEKIGKYTELAGKYRLPQEGAQELLDLHTESLKQYATTLAEQELARQHKAWDEVRSGWRTQAMADEQIGGSSWETSIGVIGRMRDQFVSGSRPGSAEYATDVKAFNDFLRITGAGDHPAFLKFLHNVGRRFDEPGLPPAGIKPPPNNGAQPGRRGMRAIYNAPAQP